MESQNAGCQTQDNCLTQGARPTRNGVTAMSSKNPISFAFSILFEIAVVVAIVSVLPRVNLRPSVSASQSSSQTLPLQMTDLRTQPQPSWINASRSYDQPAPQSAPPLIQATP